LQHEKQTSARTCRENHESNFFSTWKERHSGGLRKNNESNFCSSWKEKYSGKKIKAQSTSDISSKYQTSENSLKTSDLMLKHQKWQHCLTPLLLLAQSFVPLLRHTCHGSTIGRSPAFLFGHKDLCGGSTSALAFRDFVLRLELLTLFRDCLGIFGKVWKCVKWTISVGYILEIIFPSIFNIYHSTSILCCTTGVGGRVAGGTQALPKILIWWKSGQNLLKTQQNPWKSGQTPENMGKNGANGAQNNKKRFFWRSPFYGILFRPSLG